ncbi:Na+/H+ antiporter subunit E [Jonesiaceae bacterium BS-20]|uniref:Na+/H+ antiporter subunit E n=1 Tax=Jonesiaceae bacterium BS-20 TaxID=3120821 RepID=A0AAU7DVW8_9MICO
MSAKRRFSFKPFPWGTFVWLTLVWILLWGEFSWGNIAAGILVSAVVTVVFPLPPIDYQGTLRPWNIIKLFARFLFDLTTASIQVAIQAFMFHRTPHGAVVRVKLKSNSDLYLTIVSELSCLVPGSIVIEAHRLTGTLYLHVLDLERYGGIEKVRTDVWDLEARVMRAFASQEELDRAGIPRKRIKAAVSAESPEVTS